MRSELTPYLGEWGKEEAAHLLRRTCFGFNQGKLDEFSMLSLSGCIDRLFRKVDAPKPPVNYYFEDDIYTPIGETWVDKPYKNVSGNGTARFRSLTGWTFSLMLDNDSIIEKMTLFWHNHFVTSDIGDRRFVYKYITTLRNHALGDFKELTKLMTIDPAMLRYLNGRDNKKGSPNENYARELLELFTVGKGDLAGPGDYSTFTEDDVVEIAKSLTGWKDYGHNQETDEFGSNFVENNHDTTNKQLSPRFDNAIISNNMGSEYRDLIDIIFESENVALHLARKLYRWFVQSEISDEVELTIIDSLAQNIRDDNYQIEASLRVLLSSSHFYDLIIRGCMIKSPMDFTLTIYNQFQIEIPANLESQYRFWFDGFDEARDMQMTYYDPPDVAGWKAYYQEPVFYRYWINSVTLVRRQTLVNRLLGNGINIQGEKIKIKVLDFVSRIENATDINSLIDSISLVLFSKTLSEEQINAFKEILIPGLPDFEWTIEYQAYLNDPNDDSLRKVVESKLQGLFRALLSMPEYHMS